MARIYWALLEFVTMFMQPAADKPERNPFFTVVIPLYNKEDYIDRCLSSVLRQTHSNFEVVIVDDGSTDRGPELIHRIKDSRLRVIRQENGGVSRARNRGIAEAKGQWVAFLDADDEYKPEFLAKVYDCIQQFPSGGAVYGRAEWMRGCKQENKAQDQVSVPRLLDDYLRFIVFEKGYEIHSSAVAVAKYVFEQAGTFPAGVRVGEDSDMWLRLAWTTEVIYIPEFLGVYHMDAGDSFWELDLGKAPFWHQTYTRWSAEGKIPERLSRSAKGYYQRSLLNAAIVQSKRNGRWSGVRSLIAKRAFRGPLVLLTVKALLIISLRGRRVKPVDTLSDPEGAS